MKVEIQDELKKDIDIEENAVAEKSYSSNETSEKIKKTRDISIDLLRIVACLIVIATHLALTTYNIYEVQVDWSRLFTKCFLADGVGIFFIITGFFISNGRDYKKNLKNALKKIVLPSFIVLVISQVFYKFLINQETFINCLLNFGPENIKTILSSILHGEVHTTIPVAAHLWYIFDYIKIIIIFPILQLLCKNENQSKLARRILMILAISNMLLQDIQKFWIPEMGRLEIFSVLDPKLLMVLVGYELYCLKDKIKNNKKCAIIGFAVFAIINIIRYKCEMQYMIINQLVKEEAFVSWDTIFGLISAISLFVGIYSFEINNQFLSKIISKLGGMTFGIYLVHFMIIAKIDIFKFEKISTVKFELLYMFLGTLVIFLLSSIIILCIKTINKFKQKLLNNIKI